MKYYFLYACLGFAIAASAQHTAKQLHAHRTKVAQSKTANAVVISLDTLFCSGKPVAIAKEDMLKSGGPRLIISLKTLDTLIEISEVVPNNSFDSTQYYWYIFFFPDLNLMCKARTVDPYDPVCKHGLINRQLLDTSRAETFVTLKGSIDPKELRPGKLGLDEGQWVVPTRNIKAPLYFTSDSIGQDGHLIGTYEQSTVAAPGGNKPHYTIFNAAGAITCIATAKDTTEREWTLLTMKDKKYHPLKIHGKVSLVEIMQFLVTMVYL